jgi:acetolactate synthase-1/3 small subunit
MRQTIQIWVEDKPGALMRVVGVISAKGANIHSLRMTPDPSRQGAARITLVADVDLHLHQRVVKEMNRLVNVFEAVDVTANPREAPWPRSLHESVPLDGLGSEEFAC